MSNHNNDKNRGGSRTSEFLPNPALLESYNLVVDGSAARIITMFETEQKHRHEWENNALKTHTASTVIGQVLGFFIAMAMFVSAAVIGMNGNSTTAALIWVFGLAIIMMGGMVWVYAKKHGATPTFCPTGNAFPFSPGKGSRYRR